MMKTQKYFIPFVLVGLLMASCQKFLDIPKTSLESQILTAKDLQLLLDNPQNNAGLPSDLNLSADDFSVSDNAYLDNSITAEDRSFYTRSAGAIRNDAGDQWQSTYSNIFNANVVLEYADKFKQAGGQDQTILDQERGAALFFRAQAHWWIAQLYAKPYVAATAGQDPGIPLRLASDINEKISRGTVQQTYDRIIQDLTDAAALLPNTVVTSTRPSKAAAYAMLARVYLSMENYPLSLTNASAALQINNQLLDLNTISKTSATPFAPYSKEVLFHTVTVKSGLLEQGSSYPIANVDPDIVSAYNANDLRGQLYIKPNATATGFNFSGNYSGSAASDLFNGIAVDEVYLTRAECYARANNASAAMTDLNTLLRTRWVTGTYVDMTAVDADDALTKVLTERRKELLFRGLRWTDLRRLNHDSRFAKTLTRTVQGLTYTLPPNDLRYVLQIPNPVVQFGAVPQNPR